MVETKPIRILIVDDHALVRSGLRQFLMIYEDMKLVGEARNGLEAVDFCSKQEPDVILMDLKMPEMGGVEAIQEIRTLRPQAKIIVLSSFHEPNLVEQAIGAGAIGYLLKDVSADELAMAIRNAYAGSPTLAPEPLNELIQNTRIRSQTEFYLTNREREVLELMKAGLSNGEIASKLGISITTVKFHVRNILSKLGAKSRGEAIAIAWQRNPSRESYPEGQAWPAPK